MKCSSEWPVKSQVILNEVMSLRNIGSITRILMRVHVRNRLFHGRIESLYFDSPMKPSNISEDAILMDLSIKVFNLMVGHLQTNSKIFNSWQVKNLNYHSGSNPRSQNKKWGKKKRELYAVLIGNPQKSLYSSCLCGENLRFMSLWGQFMQQKHKASACVYDSPSSNKHTFNSNTKETGEG